MTSVVTVREAIQMIPDGASLMIGGFLGVGSPHRLISELVRCRRRDLTVIANDTARPNLGIGRLVAERLVRKLIVSHIGANAETQRQMMSGMIEVELCPQGILAERIRAAAHGLGGILTRTDIGRLAAAGKRSVEVDGEQFLFEPPLAADFALIAARHADYRGNLEYYMTTRNFNPIMAMAADKVIAEAAEFVPIGVISPDRAVTPHVLVDHLVERDQHYG